jgi:hypothetical protein
MRDATDRKPAPDLCGLRGRLGAQPVIDGYGQQPTAPPVNPSSRHQGKRHAVGATGNRDDKLRRALERTERRHQAGEFGVFDW